jgi:dipeptidyl aminopeptidase/acylaminoacyl peptidase
MFSSGEMKLVLFCTVALVSLSGTSSSAESAQRGKKQFSVAEEIGLALFEAGNEWVQFSPDGNYFAVYSERGRVDINRVEDSLTFYESRHIKRFLEHSDDSKLPPPVWVITRFADDEHSIKNWRWLADSTGVAFVEPTSRGNQRLVLANLRKRRTKSLTSATKRVEAFDILDQQHYVFTVDDPIEQAKRQAECKSAAIVGTGRKIGELILPHDSWGKSHLGTLWAVLGDEPFEVRNNGAPLVPVRDLVLSPDGRSLVTALWVAEVPSSWERLYPPPFASTPYRIRAGHQDPESSSMVFMHQYVRIKLQTGSVEVLTDAPTSYAAGWFAYGRPSWSSDGKAVLLSGTFLKSKDNAPSRPCVAVVDLSSNTSTCVERLKGHTETGMEEGYQTIQGARFVGGDKRRVQVTFANPSDAKLETAEFLQGADGTWRVVNRVKERGGDGINGFEVALTQGLNEPPLLIAKDKNVSRVIWDPNPQLKNIELGEASIYKWKDKEGKIWRGGLYKPVNYKAGERYPLVIQTHGFAESEFRPSGVMSTAFAARALAAAGIAVLQVGSVGECGVLTPDEGPCNAAGYETAANQLISEGLVDPDAIGIIGFSRTCFYVMETLTSGSLRLKAASVTDGIMADTLQYMLFATGNEFDSLIGAAPFGEGLQQWLKRSPGFNLDKVNAPLLVVGEGPLSLLFMWQPYAGLRDLHKPVDILMLNSDQHILINPAVRMASQGGSVDWFRFWLKGEEDPDPAKAEQYSRWRELRKLQEANSKAR